MYVVNYNNVKLVEDLTFFTYFLHWNSCLFLFEEVQIEEVGGVKFIMC